MSSSWSKADIIRGCFRASLSRLDNPVPSLEASGVQSRRLLGAHPELEEVSAVFRDKYQDQKDRVENGHHSWK